jgi:signal transduction histidine kinase
VVTQVSCKLTNSLFIYAETRGVSLSSLLELFDGPEEFLKDPYFWIDLSLCERVLTRSSKLMNDPAVGYSAGSRLTELHSLGALDDVFKMMPSQKDYYNNLPRFFSYFLAPMSEFQEIEAGENFIRFKFPVDGKEFPQVLGYFTGALENLPRYTGRPSANVEWNESQNELYVNWESTQSSLFQEEPIQNLNPKLVQTLSSQLEATERALQGRNREVLAHKAEIDRLKLELQTQVREKVYAEKMTGLAQLAAGVAHEINNPLSFVISNIGRFEDYFSRLQKYFSKFSPLPETIHLKKQFDIDFIFAETPAMFKEALEGLMRVKEIVKDLSSLAHPQNGRDENKMLIDINGIIDSSLKVFQDELETSRIQIKREFTLKSQVKVFPVRISQVFMNLISNAIHAIPESGMIHVKTGETQSSAFIEIADTGTGMDDAVMSRIFTPFFTTKEVGKGTGLGLSIAQSIVEMHKGHIDVKSQKGKGSRFTVTLPLSQ